MTWLSVRVDLAKRGIHPMNCHLIPSERNHSASRFKVIERDVDGVLPPPIRIVQSPDGPRVSSVTQ